VASGVPHTDATLNIDINSEEVVFPAPLELPAASRFFLWWSGNAPQTFFATTKPGIIIVQSHPVDHDLRSGGRREAKAQSSRLKLHHQPIRSSLQY